MRELGIVADGAMPIEDGHADLLPHLINKDQQRVGARHGSRQLAQGLRHEPGVQAHVTVAHLAIQLRFRNQRRHRIHHHDIDSAGADQGAGDLQRLLAVVRLRDDQVVHIHAQLARVAGIQRVLGIDKGGRSAGFLRLRDHLQRHGGLAGRLRPEDLDHPSAWKASDTQRVVHRDGAARYYCYRQHIAGPEAQDGALSELLIHLTERGVDGALTGVGVN